MKSPIINIQTYHMAMQRIDALIALGELSTDEVTDLKKLAIAVEAFEEQHFPVQQPDSDHEADFRIDQQV